MKINTEHQLPNACFYTAKHRKNLIVLHYTAGGPARSSIEWWRSQKDRIATAFVIDRDGTIYQAFPPECWAYHLGLRRVGGQNERSIAIELANWGCLKRRGNRLYTWPGNWTREFCHIDEAHRYLQAEHRGQLYWEPYPKPQIDSAASLTKHLCEQFSIPGAVHPMVRDGVCDVDFFSKFAGIAVHGNFRADKPEIGPAGVGIWDRLAA